MHSGMTRKPFILRSSDMCSDDFGALFAQMFGSLYADMPPLAQGISIGGVYGRFEGMSVRRMQYGGDFTISLPTPQDEITFVLPTAGKIIFDHRGESIGGALVGLAVDKRDIRTMRFAENHAQCGMSIRRGLFAERLSLLLGRPLPRPVCFAPVVDLVAPALQGIRALLEMATGTQFDQLINTGVLMPARLQEMLVDAVLEAWPHNYSDALRSPTPTLAPRHVKLAMAYLREHPARLESARQVLARGEGASVAEVALQHGFSNAGRFAQYFQQAFGVSPAEVRRGG
ncbi:AraC family transcriptional regulator [Pseudomonas inefficax]|uniref:AraC family transcriptional regulator n=1 Tax=Pseudomonas inefficax TaxID=2078786 RepID=UPI004046891E